MKDKLNITEDEKDDFHLDLGKKVYLNTPYMIGCMSYHGTNIHPTS